MQKNTKHIQRSTTGIKTLISFDSLIRQILIQVLPLQYPQAHFLIGRVSLTHSTLH